MCDDPQYLSDHGAPCPCRNHTGELIEMEEIVMGEDDEPGTTWVPNPCGCSHKSHGENGCNQNMASNAPIGSKCSTCISMGH